MKAKQITSDEINIILTIFKAISKCDDEVFEQMVMDNGVSEEEFSELVEKLGS